MNKDTDLERLCRLAKELNISQRETAIKYGEYKALDGKVGQNKAYNRTVNYLTMRRIELNSKNYKEDCVGL